MLSLGASGRNQPCPQTVDFGSPESMPHLQFLKISNTSHTCPSPLPPGAAHGPAQATVLVTPERVSVQPRRPVRAGPFPPTASSGFALHPRTPHGCPDPATSRSRPPAPAAPCPPTPFRLVLAWQAPRSLRPPGKPPFPPGVRPNSASSWTRTAPARPRLPACGPTRLPPCLPPHSPLAVSHPLAAGTRCAGTAVRCSPGPQRKPARVTPQCPQPRPPPPARNGKTTTPLTGSSPDLRG